MDERRRLVHKTDPLTEKERNRLSELNNRLESLRFTTAVRDPLYERFAKTWTKRENLAWQNAPALTEDQRSAQEKLAAEIIDEMLKEEGLTP